MSEKAKQLIFWVITITFPFLILLLIEGALRIGGYNEEAQDLFIEAPNSNRFLVSNVKFIERYFPSFVPEIAPNAFRKIKQKIHSEFLYLEVLPLKGSLIISITVFQIN